MRCMYICVWVHQCALTAHVRKHVLYSTAWHCNVFSSGVGRSPSRAWMFSWPFFLQCLLQAETAKSESNTVLIDSHWLYCLSHTTPSSWSCKPPPTLRRAIPPAPCRGCTLPPSAWKKGRKACRGMPISPGIMWSGHSPVQTEKPSGFWSRGILPTSVHAWLKQVVLSCAGPTYKARTYRDAVVWLLLSVNELGARDF